MLKAWKWAEMLVETMKPEMRERYLDAQVIEWSGATLVVFHPPKPHDLIVRFHQSVPQGAVQRVRHG